MQVFMQRRVPRGKGFFQPVSIHETFGFLPAAVLFDFNGVVVDDEAHQEHAWLSAIAGTFADSVTSEVLDRAHAHVRWVFRTGNFIDFSAGLWRIFEQNCARIGVNTAEELDAHLATHRNQHISRLVRSQKIFPNDGIEEFLGELINFEIPLGLFTANNREPVEDTMDCFFADRAKKYFPRRLFGKDREFATAMKSKPYSDGYRQLAAELEVKFSDAVVIEDHLESIRHCVVDGIGGAVWIHQFRSNPAKAWAAVRRALGPLSGKVILAKSPAYLRL